MNDDERPVEIIAPEWIETGTITIKLSELNATATAELIECLSDENETDPRVKLLKDLWTMLTG